MDPYVYIERLPFPVLSKTPKPMPIMPDESGDRVILRLNDKLRAEMHQKAHMLVQAPMVQRQRAGMVIAPEHCHDYFEISFILNGAYTNRLADGAEQQLQPGDVMLIPPFAAHSLIAGMDNSVMFNFMLDADYTEKILYLHDLRSLAAFARSQRSYGAQSECLICTGNTGRLWAIAAEVLREYYTPDQVSDQMTDAFVLPLLTMFDSMCTIRHHEDNAIESAIRYIMNNPAKAHLESVAQRFGYSPDYLSRLMKKHTGLSFQQLRQKSASEQAAHLLAETLVPVSEIAEKVGISNLTRFYKLFQTNYGCSPSEYRSKLNNPDKK